MWCSSQNRKALYKTVVFAVSRDLQCICTVGGRARDCRIWADLQLQGMVILSCLGGADCMGD